MASRRSISRFRHLTRLGFRMRRLLGIVRGSARLRSGLCRRHRSRRFVPRLWWRSGGPGSSAPSTGPCCYEVDEPVTAEFARAFGERWRSWVTPSRGGRVMLDLWSANEALLAEAGVAPASIENPRLCTACHPDLLYSYR